MLLTGFGPFPGAPHNPTQELVARLLRLRRPALMDVDLTGHIFPVTYQAIDRQLPELLAAHQPDALLMFGLAARTRHLRIESRARNAVSTLWPDAARSKGRNGSIAHGVHARHFGPHSARLLRAALSTGIDARLSRDAGRYLCNYLSWRAIEATGADGLRVSAFIHVPAPPRGAGAASGITAEQLIDAGEAVLLELIRAARQKRRESLTLA